ncbi:MAG: hypothetical protein Q8P23_03995 [bacterium]|nr:hypothetical protein [bacterium]
MDELPSFFEQNKKVILVAACVLLLVLVGGAGALYYMNVQVQKSASTISTPQIVDINQAKSDAALPSSATPILPKSKVTPAYYVSYSATVNELILVENAHKNEVSPLLLQAQTAITNNDSQTLASIGVKAQGTNDTQKKRLAILSADFDNLSAVAATLTDATTTSLTNDFISAGKKVVTVYSAYSRLIDDMISGNLTAQSVIDAKSIASDSTSSAATFRDASKKLSLYFSDSLATDLLPYLSATSSAQKK